MTRAIEDSPVRSLNVLATRPVKGLASVEAYLSPAAARWFPAYLEARSWSSRPWVAGQGLEANAALERQLLRMRGEPEWTDPTPAVDGLEDPARGEATMRRRYDDAQIAGALRVGGTLQGAAERSGLSFATLAARRGGLQLQKVAAHISAELAEMFETAALPYDQAVSRMLYLDTRLAETAPPWLRQGIDQERERP